jgi:hypothetical protein
MASEDHDLSGAWKGFFNYPRALPATPFDAELREHLGTIAGETFELGTTARNRGQPLHAMIEGQRQGREVLFVKRYDEFRRAATPVHYSGTLSSDGNEISGTWTIPGNWSGTFLMIRARPKAAAAERRIAETVR